MVGDVVFGVAVILVFGISMLFLDRGDLGVAHAFDLRPTDAMLCALPLYGVFGFMTVLATLAGGAACVLQPVFDAAQAAQWVRTHRITHAVGSDSMFAPMLEQPGFDGQSLRHIIQADFVGLAAEVTQRGEALSFDVGMRQAISRPDTSEQTFRSALKSLQHRARADLVALLDEARNYLGVRPSKTGKPDDDEIRTYGHIVIDEVQDLTPMQLRMVSRRSLNGSMTVVGDIAQATGSLAPNDWDDVVRHLPTQRGSRVIGLSVGYRIPARIMELANKVMMVATPSLRAPTSVRAGDEAPEFVQVVRPDLMSAVIAATKELDAEVGDGNIAVVVPDSMFEEVAGAFTSAGIEHGEATRSGLGMGITVVPVSVVKGLELDGVIVVEPARIVADETQGMRALYVALTRSTKRLTIVYSDPLPEAMH